MLSLYLKQTIFQLDIKTYTHYEVCRYCPNTVSRAAEYSCFTAFTSPNEAFVNVT